LGLGDEFLQGVQAVGIEFALVGENVVSHAAVRPASRADRNVDDTSNLFCITTIAPLLRGNSSFEHPINAPPAAGFGETSDSSRFEIVRREREHFPHGEPDRRQKPDGLTFGTHLRVPSSGTFHVMLNKPDAIRFHAKLG